MAKAKEKTAGDLAREDILSAMRDACVDKNAEILDDIRDTLPEALAVLGVTGLHRALRMRSGFTASRRYLVNWLDANKIRERKAVPAGLLKAHEKARERASAKDDKKASETPEKQENVPEAAKAAEQAQGGEWDETVPEAVPEAGEEQSGNAWGPMRSREGKIMTTGGYVSPEELDKEREAIKAGRK